MIIVVVIIIIVIIVIATIIIIRVLLVVVPPATPIRLTMMFIPFAGDSAKLQSKNTCGNTNWKPQLLLSAERSKYSKFVCVCICACMCACMQAWKSSVGKIFNRAIFVLAGAHPK